MEEGKPAPKDFPFTPTSTVTTTVEQLASMTDGDYVLGNYITINASSWTPITRFTGTFDGSDYTTTRTNTSKSSKLPVDSYFAIFGTNSGTATQLNSKQRNHQESNGERHTVRYQQQRQ